MHLKLTNLHMGFGSIDVLRGIDIEVPPGEICVILGGSGTGKSVTLKLILGLLRPDQGQVFIDGKETTHLSESELVTYRRRFGVIFQSGGMLASLTVGENVGLGLSELTSQADPSIMEVVREKLGVVGLGGREMQDPATLSGGQRKRAAIARALTMKSDCLLLDEPTAGLDPPTAKTIEDVIGEVNRETKATCILVTHDLVMALRLGDRLHLLHEGRIAASGTPAEFVNSTNPIVRSFLQRDLDFFTNIQRTSKEFRLPV